MRSENVFKADARIPTEIFYLGRLKYYKTTMGARPDGLHRELKEQCLGKNGSKIQFIGPRPSLGDSQSQIKETIQTGSGTNISSTGPKSLGCNTINGLSKDLAS